MVKLKTRFFLNKKIAFTLAETLIGLTIIGIISSMTITTLSQRHEESVTVASVKNAYSLLDQGFRYASYKYGAPSSWGLVNSSCDKQEDGSYECENESGVKVYEIILSGIKHRLIDGEEGYQPKDLDGKISMKSQVRPVYSLENGTTLLFPAYVEKSNCSYQLKERLDLSASNYFCGDLKIDINGKKGPNTLGRDIFVFDITEEGIFPTGILRKTDLKDSCNRKNNTEYNGYGCAAWVVQKGNMDYLKGKEISWD